MVEINYFPYLTLPLERISNRGINQFQSAALLFSSIKVRFTLDQAIREKEVKKEP
jgi:hypothetical protein